MSGLGALVPLKVWLSPILIKTVWPWAESARPRMSVSTAATDLKLAITFHVLMILPFCCAGCKRVFRQTSPNLLHPVFGICFVTNDTSVFPTQLNESSGQGVVTVEGIDKCSAKCSAGVVRGLDCCRTGSLRLRDQPRVAVDENTQGRVAICIIEILPTDCSSLHGIGRNGTVLDKIIRAKTRIKSPASPDRPSHDHRHDIPDHRRVAIAAIHAGVESRYTIG